MWFSFEEKGIWESGLVNIDKVMVEVPEKVIRVMDLLHKENPDIEVGGYLKFKTKIESDRLIYEVEPDIYIPEQTCTAGSIKFDEPPPQGFKGVIHKHPAGVKSFSATDEKYINANFDLSLLYEPSANTITDAVVRLELKEGVKLRLKPAVEIVREPIKFEYDKSKIKRAVYTHRYSRYYQTYTPYETLYAGPTIMTKTKFETELQKRGFKKEGKDWVKKEKYRKITISEYTNGEVIIEYSEKGGISDVFIADYSDALEYIDIYLSDF